MHLGRFFAVLLIFFVYSPLLNVVGAPLMPMADITITVTNHGSFDHTYEFKDGVSGRTWSQPVGAGASAQVSLHSNQSIDDGYGDLYWRPSGNSTWNHSSMLRHGEKVSL
jgi:hypothetical protein